MKKLISTITMTAVLAVMVPAFAGTSNAQTTRYYGNTRRATTVYKKPSLYRRHRNLFNIAIGTGAGALLGGLLGGKKGALYGTAIGAGSSALYTYKLKPKQRRYQAQYFRRY